MLTKSQIEWHYPHMQHQPDECEMCYEICKQAILAIEYEQKIATITVWLEENQPDVFRRGMWDRL